MEVFMSYYHSKFEYLPAIVSLTIFVWLIFGNNDIFPSFLEFGKTYQDFNGFFCAGWAGTCR